jgi:hypothetical protein
VSQSFNPGIHLLSVLCTYSASEVGLGDPQELVWKDGAAHLPDDALQYEVNVGLHPRSVSEIPTYTGAASEVGLGDPDLHWVVSA